MQRAHAAVILPRVVVVLFEPTVGAGPVGTRGKGRYVQVVIARLVVGAVQIRINPNLVADRHANDRRGVRGPATDRDAVGRNRRSR